jgi:hypothetical protein
MAEDWTHPINARDPQQLDLIDAIEAQKIIDAKTAPKVTRESIEAKIESTEFILHATRLTICIIRMFNGFMVVGHQAPASEKNFDREVGKRLAYDDAFRQLWPLEGYVLREKLSGGYA